MQDLECGLTLMECLCAAQKGYPGHGYDQYGSFFVSLSFSTYQKAVQQQSGEQRVENAPQNLVR